MNKPYFCRKFFLTDWRHKHLKNKIDLLLFYREHFYGFSESDFFVPFQNITGIANYSRKSFIFKEYVVKLLIFSAPTPNEEKKINLNVHFHSPLWGLKRF